MTILWKIEDERGNALLGFKSEEECKKALPRMRPNRKWRIWPYIPIDEKNDLKTNN